MNGSEPSEDQRKGRVEICYNNTYGSVCDDFFNENAAAIVCNGTGQLKIEIVKLIIVLFLLLGHSCSKVQRLLLALILLLALVSFGTIDDVMFDPCYLIQALQFVALTVHLVLVLVPSLWTMLCVLALRTTS